jgi:hypothetical protein
MDLQGEHTQQSNFRFMTHCDLLGKTIWANDRGTSHLLVEYSIFLRSTVTSGGVMF